MPNDLKPSNVDNAEWNAAVAAVSRLAGARHGLRSLQEEKTGEANVAPTPPADIDSDELAQAHREIEKAAAALQVVHPDLTMRTDVLKTEPSQQRRWPVWLLIGFIWTGMVAVAITAIQALKTLM